MRRRGRRLESSAAGAATPAPAHEGARRRPVGSGASPSGPTCRCGRHRRAGDPGRLREPRRQHDPADRGARARRLGAVRCVHRRRPSSRSRSPWRGRAAGPTAAGPRPVLLWGMAAFVVAQVVCAPGPHHDVLRRRPGRLGRGGGAHRHLSHGARRPGAPRRVARQGVRLVRRGLDPPLAARPQPRRRHRRPVGVAVVFVAPLLVVPVALWLLRPALRRTHAGGATAANADAAASERRRRGGRAGTRHRARDHHLLGPPSLQPRHARARRAW